MLTKEIKEAIKSSVLCWLATADANGQPSVSPKEIFTAYQDRYILVANIASPGTMKNIRQNPKVCISFIDILVQKGFQVKGTAALVDKKHAEFEALAVPLSEMTAGKFPFASLTKIAIETVKPIIAPRYLLYPETTEAQQIESAKKQYGV